MLVEKVERRVDQNGIVNRRTDFDAALGCQATGQAEHLGAIGLHRVVHQRTRVGFRRQVHEPPKDRVDAAGVDGTAHRTIGTISRMLGKSRRRARAAHGTMGVSIGKRDAVVDTS